MEERPFLAGIMFVVGGLPFLVTYGIESWGLFGVVLVLVGAVVAYAATRV